ncbi:prepilin-type N-terminal cleavage/methylation domain-containing protein [Synechococcus sp. CCY 9618]|uniref:type IV pilus modification PilV family protein n=1 Tax=Synechococcus sp. CCY 9618 TaxID=2815602 RepID=UPI001C22700F
MAYLPAFTRAKGLRLYRASNVRGFTLIELLASTLVLVIAVAGTANLFIRSNQVSASTNRRFSLQALVDQDLASIQRLNDRYTCVSGTACVIASGDPTKTGYFPDATNATSVAFFVNRCNYSSGDLVTGLKALINSNVPSPTGVAREIETDGDDGATNTTQRGAHRYRVNYRFINPTTTEEEFLRSVEFVPTAVSWCP